MHKTEMVEWIRREFAPIELITEDETILQQVDNALRYWNTHSAHKVIKMFPFAASKGCIDIPQEFRLVTRVYPADAPDHIWRNNPTWLLTGIYMLESHTQDLIAMTQSFKDYKVYMGLQLAFYFNRNPDPEQPHKLIINNMPAGNSAICVEGVKRIKVEEDALIVDEHIQDWILYYAKALVKMVEGNILRKSSSSGIVNDGQELLSEGKEERAELQQRLAAEGRWMAFIQRG